MMIDYVEMAKVMYQSYGEYTGNKNYQGLEMPKWSELGGKIQGAWEKAAITAHLYVNRLYIEEEEGKE